MSKVKRNIVYKTTNTVDGKIYVGVHRTYDITDDYLGSGSRLLEAVAKYGKDCFKREILREFDDIQDAYDYEKTIVDSSFVAREDTYNVRVGGNGGRGRRFTAPLRERMYADMRTLGRLSDETYRLYELERKEGRNKL